MGMSSSSQRANRERARRYAEWYSTLSPEEKVAERARADKEHDQMLLTAVIVALVAFGLLLGVALWTHVPNDPSSAPEPSVRMHSRQ